MHQIAKGFFYEDSYLGVTLGGLVFPHGIIYIDAPLRFEDARTWRSILLGQRGGNHRLLINLDAHPDRTLGAKSLDCTVVAHQKTAQVFRNRPNIFKGQTVETGSTWEEYSDAIGMRWAAPDITFSQCISLHWEGSEVILEHHGGSTIGACWVILPSEHILFLGDALVIGQPPFLANADIPDWLESLEFIKTNYSDYFLIAGRGGKGSLEDIEKQRNGLEATLKGIEKLAKHHATPESTQDLIPGLLKEFDIPVEQQGRYSIRLKYGLYQYFARRYRPSSSLETLRFEESEQ